MYLNKIKIYTPHIAYVLNADESLLLLFQKENITISNTISDANSIHLFSKNQKELNKQLQKINTHWLSDRIIFCYFPKGNSKLQTDLTRDKGWEALMARQDIKYLSLVSYNEVWSVFSFRKKTIKEINNNNPKSEREINKYVDSKTKIIILPEDVSRILSKNKIARERFHSLTFTYRKEYVEWIITAKKEETRANRINEMIEKLVVNK